MIFIAPFLENHLSDIYNASLLAKSRIEPYLEVKIEIFQGENCTEMRYGVKKNLILNLNLANILPFCPI